MIGSVIVKLQTVYQNLISNKEDDAIDSIKRFEIDSINEALTLDGDGNYKYKKYVTKAFHKIHPGLLCGIRRHRERKSRFELRERGSMA